MRGGADDSADQDQVAPRLEGIPVNQTEDEPNKTQMCLCLL